MKNNVLAQLSSVQSIVTSTVEECLSSKKVARITQSLNAARSKTAAALAAVAEHPQRRNLNQTKKSLTVIDNLLSGLAQGLEDRELSVKEFRATCSNLQTNFVQKFGESLSSEIEKFKSEAGITDDVVIEDENLTEDQQRIRTAILANTEMIANAATDEVSEDEETAEEKYDRESQVARKIDEDRKANLDEVGANVERRLARLRAMRNQLPERMTAPYSMVRLPVVPNFETEAAKNPVLLDKIAIPFTEIPLYGATGGTGVPIGLTKVKMERYVIFEQQMILLISKSYVQSLLDHKTGKIDEDNKADFGGHRQQRKQLAYQIDVAKNSVDKAVTEFQKLPSQKEEIKRLSEKLKRVTGEVDQAIRAGYTDDEKELFRQVRQLRGKISIQQNQIDKLQEDYRNKPEHRTAENQKLVDDSFEEIAALDKKLAPLQKKINVVNKRLAKTADLKKKLEQIDIMERKLDKAQSDENHRQRLIPEAEELLKRLTRESERNEDTLKNKRKAVKRAGDAITPEDYARSVLSIINERSGSKYALVTTRAAPNPRNSRDILCFWLMQTSKLSALMSATGGKAKVTEWDFPFDSERHVTIDAHRKEWVHPSNDPSNPEYLEYNKNKQHRPEGWKSRYGKPAKRIEQ